jgi:outer membrane biosynthesis protein TonB
VQRALERNYPPLLRDAGIGGTPVVWFFIDENGRVLKDAAVEVERLRCAGRGGDPVAR